MDSTQEAATAAQTPSSPGGCAPADGSPASLMPEQELNNLGNAVCAADREIMRLEAQIAHMREKQHRRRQELVAHWTRIHAPKRSPRVFDHPVPGARMVLAQTDSGIAARWVLPPENDNVTHAAKHS